MRKDVIIIILCASVLLICGCKREKGCTYGDTVYNEETNECDCVNWKESEIPGLSIGTYNSVGAVRMNYDYRVKSYSEYPYYNRQGDTIKVFGWFWFGDIEGGIHGDTLPLIGAGSPTLTLLNIHDFVGLFDTKDTCFVTGVLEFQTPDGKKAVTEHAECFLVDYVLQVVDIHN